MRKLLIPLALLFATPAQAQTAAEIKAATADVTASVWEADKIDRGRDLWGRSPINGIAAEIIAKALLEGNPALLAMLDRLRPKTGGQVCDLAGAEAKGRADERAAIVQWIEGRK